MSSLPVTVAKDRVLPGEAYLLDTPVLRTHAGTQPDLFLRWNAVPRSATAIDVVVFLHGFSQEGGSMPLSEKVGRSGLDLSGRTRPTLAMIPRGNWLRYSWYDFPALLGGGLDTLVEYAVGHFRQAIAIAELKVDRLILMAHSGGGMPAVDAIAGAVRAPDELYIFDGLYGRDPSRDDPLRGLETLDRWLAKRVAAEPARPGALRVVYIERQTGEFSRELAKSVTRHLAAADAALTAGLSRRYKVEVSGVPHGYIARECAPALLAASDAMFDWAR